MQIYRIREGKFYVPFLLENIYEYLFDEKTCLLLNRNKVYYYLPNNDLNQPFITFQVWTRPSCNIL